MTNKDTGFDVVLVATHADAEEAVESIGAINAWLMTPEGAAAAEDAFARGVPLLWPPGATPAPTQEQLEGAQEYADAAVEGVL